MVGSGTYVQVLLTVAASEHAYIVIFSVAISWANKRSFILYVNMHVAGFAQTVTKNR